MTRKIPLAAMFLALVSCGGGKGTQAGNTESADGGPEAKVKTVKSVLSDREQGLTLAGKVTSDPDKTIIYRTLVSGIIEKTWFSLGDKVTKGQAMLDIRSTELSALQSELVSLQSELAVARRELKTAEAMYGDNMLSERELLEAGGRVRQAEAALAKVQADMSVYGTDKGGGVFSVMAPMSGYVISKDASAGSTASPDGEPLFTVADLGTVWVVANVYAGNLQFVKEGMEAVVTAVAYPGETFRGKIDALSQVFDPEDKAMKARIVLRNDGLKLKPEMSVSVALTNRGERSVSVPTKAVIFDNDAYFVVVRQGEGFAIRDIVLGGHDRDDDTTYVSSGLEEGEDVVVENQLLIFAGLKAE